MAKKIVEDIIPPKSKTIRKIPIPQRSRKSRPQPEETLFDGENNITIEKEEETYKLDASKESGPKEEHTHTTTKLEIEYEDEPETESQEEYYEEPRKSRKGIWIIAAAFVAIVVIVIAMSLFVSAKVSITPIRKEVVLNSMQFFAEKNPADKNLKFETAAVVKELRKEVPATLQKKIEKKASGAIVIFNETANPQTLVINTRFESSNSLIYRISKAVTIPGARKDASGKLIPGSKEVTVTADAFGDKYNIGLSDFTIPGFKNDPKYKTIYARSKTAMTGGSSGTQNNASDDVISKTRTELKAQLSDQLFKELSLRKPENYILFATGTTIVFEDLPSIQAGSSSVYIIERGTISGVMFSKTALGTAIAQSAVPRYDGTPVILENPEVLSISIHDPSKFSPLTSERIGFNLTGKVQLKWQYDVEKLKSDLIGKNVNELNKILDKRVQSAEASITPFWVTHFPTKTSAINIIEQ